MENQKQPTIQPQMPVQPVTEQLTPEKNPFSRWLLIFAGLVLLTILFSGVYFLGIYQGQSQKPASKIQAITPTPTTLGSPKPTAQATDPTATWKTFSNQYLSFKYPADLKIVDPYPDTPDQSRHIGVMPYGKTLGGSVPPIVITRLDNPKNQNLQQWEEERNAMGGQASSYYKSTTKTTIIGGHTAYFNENDNCEPYSCYQVFVMGKDNIFDFFNVDYGNYPLPGATASQTYTRAEQDNIKQIFQEILTTVKLTQ